VHGPQLPAGGISLNAAELHALDGLPHLSITEYVLGIRPKMHPFSGLACTSWRELGEATYIASVRGYRPAGSEKRPGTFTRFQLARAAKWLEQNKLVRRCSGKEGPLIFDVRLASRGTAVSRRSAHTSAHKSAQLDMPFFHLVKGAGSPKSAHISALKSARTLLEEEEEERKESADQTPGAQKKNSHVVLYFPPPLEPATCAALTELLDGHPRAQDLLDELTGQMLRKPIPNPVAYMRRMVRTAGPDWVGDFAGEVRARRARVGRC
jgi:hypothetical protein